jgi:hypothetical protein
MASPRLGFTFVVDGLEDMVEGLLPELDRQLDRAMVGAVDLVANEAKRRAPSKTGELTLSIAGTVHGSFSSETLVGVVSAGAPHALAVEDGSRAHVIRPRFRRALRFAMGGGAGGFGYAKKVDHPGTAPQPFLEPALESSIPDIDGEFDAAVKLAKRKAGFR